MYKLIFISILISSFIPSFPYDLPEEKIKKLDEMINTQLKDANLNTVGLIIINSHTVLHKKIYGEHSEVPNEKPFIIGSVSKSFTALGILNLEIDLNQTLDKFDLDDYIDKDDAKEITISELLNHTSGLDSFSSDRIYKKGFFNYSNYGFGLLGKIIEKQSKLSYQEYIKEKIFSPLGMSDTYAEYNSEIIDSYNNFLGFRTKYGDVKSDMGVNGFYIPAGFISSSMDDMGKYLGFYLDPKNKKYIDQMTKGTIEIGYNTQYGMGMMIQKTKNITIYKHTGETLSFKSLLTVYPEIDLAFFIVTNTQDFFCSIPSQEFIDNIEKFLLYDTYDDINSSLFFYVHFTFDMIFFFFISLPVVYMVISIIRKIKKTKYSWFIGGKGKCIFILDLFLLIIMPIIIILSFYLNSLTKYLIRGNRDFQFLIWTIFAVSLFTFIIKLAYVFIYNKYLKKFEIKDIKDINDKDLDYIGMNE